MQDYKYNFSVVIPIYNVEKYLEETIESVVNQSIGFKKNIQMILVNDGSPDNCEDICLKYKQKYPQNIIYIKQENQGVSAARNNGKKFAEGKYINFIDSDDKWELNVFEKVYKMFEEHDEIDVIGVRQKLFDAENGYHLLDYKFTSDRIIDINEEYDCIQLNLSSGFFRTSAIENKDFDTKVKYSEDVKFLFNIILEKEKYGVISSSVHFYRKRFESNSALQQAKEDISYYTDTVEYVFRYILNLSLKKYNKIIPYVQYYLMYELRWRIFSKITEKLDQSQRDNYINTVKELLNYIDDKIIFEIKNTNREQRIYCACLKYGKDIREEFVLEKNRILFNNITVAKIGNRDFFKICLIDIIDDKLCLEGKIRNIYPDKDYYIFLKNNNGQKFDLQYFEIPSSQKFSFLGECYYKDIGYRVEVPAKEIKQYSVMIEYKNNQEKRLYLNFKETSGLNENMEKMYLVKKKYIISTAKNKIYIQKNSLKRRLRKKWNYIKEYYLKSRISK